MSQVKGMTLQAISGAAGCGYATVKREAKRLWPGVLWRNRRLLESEARALMDALPKRNAVMAQTIPTQGSIEPTPAPDRIARLEAMVDRMAGAMVDMLAILQKQLPALTAPKQLPPPPELSPRDALRKLVSDHAARNGRDYGAAWRNLYSEFELRTHRAIRANAKRRGMDTLDYVESEDSLGELLSIAFLIYGKKSA